MTRRAPALAAASLLAALACGRRAAAPSVPEDEVWLSQEAMERGHVQIAAAAEEPVVDPVLAGGRIAFEDLRVTHVYSPVTGRVTRVLAQPGQKVKKGAPLAAVLSPDVGTAFSDLAKAQADLVSFEKEYERQELLLAANASPRRDFETAEDNYRKAKAEFERAREKAALLRTGTDEAATQEYLVRSYIDGEVMARTVNPGMEVQGQYSGGSAVELFTVGDIDRVWALADVAEADLPRVRVGAEASVRVVAYPDRAFRGRVEWVSATLDPALRTARVRVSLENRDWDLKPEMYAQVSIATEPRLALVVPRDALVRVNDQAFLFVAGGRAPDGRMAFQRRRVRVGEDHGSGRVTVLEGAKAGDSVVVRGAISRDQPNDEAWITAAQMKAASIRVEEVRERDLEDVVQIGGRLAFDDQRVTHVFSPVSGRITRVLADVGQRVRKGAPLVAVVSPDVGSAASDVVKARADLAAAEHEFQRQKELVEARAGAQRDLEAAEGSFRKARAEYQRSLEKTRLLHEGTIDEVTQEFVLRSPIEGEVVARSIGPGMEIQGQYSGASNVVELFTIGDPSRLWVLGDVYEMDLPRIHEGDSVSIRVAAYPGRVFQGTVDWVGDVLDPATHTARARIVLPNPDRLLKPEMYQMVTIAVPGKQVLAVPRRALVRLGDATVVFVEGGQTPDGRVAFKRRRVVANEEKGGGVVPILDGLAPGERVIVEGAIFAVGAL